MCYKLFLLTFLAVWRRSKGQRARITANRGTRDLLSGGMTLFIRDPSGSTRSVDVAVDANVLNLYEASKEFVSNRQVMVYDGKMLLNEKESLADLSIPAEATLEIQNSAALTVLFLKDMFAETPEYFEKARLDDFEHRFLDIIKNCEQERFPVVKEECAAKVLCRVGPAIQCDTNQQISAIRLDNFKLGPGAPLGSLVLNKMPTTVRRIGVHGNIDHVDFSGLQRHSQLERVDLARNQIKQIDFKQFGGSSIIHLNLRENDLSEVDLDEWMEESMIISLNLVKNVHMAKINLNTLKQTSFDGRFLLIGAEKILPTGSEVKQKMEDLKLEIVFSFY